MGAVFLQKKENLTMSSDSLEKNLIFFTTKQFLKMKNAYSCQMAKVLCNKAADAFLRNAIFFA
jgi:hypothetical protein